MNAIAQDAGSARLLAAGDPPPFSIERPDAASEFLLVCDHAAARLPQAMGALGLSVTQLESHIGWDIGAAGVARGLAERLDATLLLQNYSRLVIDCNRPLHADDSIATHSEWVRVDGNAQLDDAQIAARTDEVFTPYHEALSGLLDERHRAGRATVLVALHSFTPVYRGESRPWHIGVMYGRDAALGQAILRLLGRDERLVVGDNEPYALDEQVDYTLPTHGQGRGIPHVGLEIRQDLIADAGGQKNWAGRLASLLRQAAASDPHGAPRVPTAAARAGAAC